MKRGYEIHEKELKNLTSTRIEKIGQERYRIKNIFIAIKINYILSDYIFYSLSRRTAYIKCQYCNSEFNIEE